VGAGLARDGVSGSDAHLAGEQRISLKLVRPISALLCNCRITIGQNILLRNKPSCEIFHPSVVALPTALRRAFSLKDLQE
jgi:hypothetical protein